MATRKELFRQLFNDMDTSKRLMQPCFANVMHDAGVSPAQAHILLMIDDSQPISLKTLAAKMWLTPGAVTQLVDGVARMGYLTRARDEKDRRIIYLNLSPAGAEVLTKITQYRSEVMAKIMSSLDDTELQQLAIVQRKITQHLAENFKQYTTRKEKI